MRIEADTAYVLHKRPYRETSLLLDVFSSSHGRIGLIARGAKRQKSGQSVLLQPFRRLSMSWSARGELGNLTTVESDGSMPDMNAEAFIAGFYVNELVVRLLHRYEAHPQLFDAYEAVLKILDAIAQRQSGLRYFELSLLEAIGYGLVLDHDVVSGKPLQAAILYQYVSERGPSAETIMPGHYVNIHGQTLLELATRSLSTDASQLESKKLLRQELACHLGDKPLASRALYQSYLRNQDS